MVNAHPGGLPRVVIAAAGSGQGKTSIATGLLGAFRARGLTVSPHKVGPDYIDPGYHGLAAGRPGRNLDPWLVGEELIVPLFVHGATTPTRADIAIVEGVMGLFDGATGRGDFASTAHVARLLKAPIVLVVDGSGVGRSVAALVHGFTTFDPTIRIGGVILNRLGTLRHEQILREAVEAVGVPVLGAVYRQDALAVPSRHLGLIPAAERTAEAIATVDVLAQVIGASVDLAAIEALAATAAELEAGPELFTPAAPRTRIAVAGGAAFTFGYAEQAEILAAGGAEVVTVDPLRDEKLPEDTSGLVIGGGFPEVHAAELSANESLRSSIRELAATGAPIAAECAGLLYLARDLDGHPMCGVLDAQAQMTPRLSLGYREAVAPVDSVLAVAGTRVRGHEFHRTTCESGSATPAWQWHGPDGVVADGVVAGGVHASYLHLHWAGNPQLAQRFVDAAVSA
jgi:cobyrinic acid a,c-diamide synthase